MLSLNKEQFWYGIYILLRNYHAVNKKIFACVINEVQKVNKGFATALHELDVEKIIQGKDDENVSCIRAAGTESDLNILTDPQLTSSFNGEALLVKFKFLTKKLQQNIEAVGIIDFINTTYTCKFQPHFSLDDFCIKYSNADIEIELLSQRRKNIETSIHWNEFVLKPKLLKWCKSTHTTNGDDNCSTTTKQIQSLQLIDVEAYNDLYKELKQKFAEKAMEFWTDAKESTDPLKFIYEDLAIASYLITLWRSQDLGIREPHAFADLGCGNGLLVYILNEMGYLGYGFDIRARKIWSYYPANVQQKLLEQAVVPNCFQLPKEVDWLIGNHSDELSAWLPVMAANASLEMCYFLLPCCAYELSGAKFQRRNTKSSTYQDFFKYLQYISEFCGFKTLKDRLKIPSTKRLALVGIERRHGQNEYLQKKLEIKNIVTEEIRRYIATENNNQQEIKLREKSETVRNCTKIDKNILAALVKKIFNLLLMSPVDNDDCIWAAGGHLSMREIVQHLAKDDVKHIKAECGGIKTLLRNHHEIFKFCGGDMIGIRKPQVVESTNKPQTVKKRLCYFKENHPNGCPLTDEECTFLH